VRRRGDAAVQRGGEGPVARSQRADVLEGVDDLHGAARQVDGRRQRPRAARSAGMTTRRLDDHGLGLRVVDAHAPLRRHVVQRRPRSLSALEGDRTSAWSSA
jgi:hypothetical protein